jgi:hypothetical protein
VQFAFRLHPILDFASRLRTASQIDLVGVQPDFLWGGPRPHRAVLGGEDGWLAGIGGDGSRHRIRHATRGNGPSILRTCPQRTILRDRLRRCEPGLSVPASFTRGLGQPWIPHQGGAQLTRTQAWPSTHERQVCPSGTRAAGLFPSEHARRFQPKLSEADRPRWAFRFPDDGKPCPNRRSQSSLS